MLSFPLHPIRYLLPARASCRWPGRTSARDALVRVGGLSAAFCRPYLSSILLGWFFGSFILGELCAMSRPRSQLPTQEDLIESQARTLALARERRAEAERWEQAEAERRQDEAQAQAAIGPAEGLDMQNIRLICVAVVAALALAAIGTALGGGTLQYQRRLTTVRVAPEIPAPPEASRATAEERNWTRGLWAPSQPPSLAAATDRTPQHRKGHTQKRKKGLRRHKHASEELGLLRPPPPPPPLPSSEPPRRRKKRRRSQAQPPPAEPAQPAPEAQPQPQPQEQPQTPPPPRRRKRKRRSSSSSVYSRVGSTCCAVAPSSRRQASRG